MPWVWSYKSKIFALSDNILRLQPDALNLRILIIAFALSALHCTAQQLQKKFEQITSEDGLANSTINHLIQDSKGFIWIATQGGLHKYDGYQFTVYRHNTRDTSSLSNNHVLSLCESQGSIYVGTRNGLNILDPTTGRFEYYIDYEDKPGLLRDKSIRSIYDDKRGRIWVAVSEVGVLVFDQNEKRFVRMLSQSDAYPNSLSGNHIKCIEQDASGGFWFGGDGGLTRFDEDANSFEHYTAGDQSLVHNFVKTIAKDHEGNFWVGTDGGLSYAAVKDGKIIRFENYTKGIRPTDLPSSFVKSIVEDAGNRIWVATDGGLTIFNPSTKKFNHYSVDSSDPFALVNNSCHTLLKDQQNNIWIGTDKGISKYDEGRFPFNFVPLSAGRRAQHDFVTSIVEDDSHQLWVGTDEGLKIYSPATGTVKEFEKAGSGKFADNFITALDKGRDGSIWIGTGDGVYKFSPASRKLTRINLGNTSVDEVTGILCVLVEGESVWVGTWNGLKRYDDSTGKITSFMPGKINGRVQTLLRDSEGLLWIGTRSKLAAFDPADSSLIEYVHDNNDASSISNHDINCIYEGRQPGIWVGTNGGGLNFFDKATKKFYRYSWDDGLPSDNVASITSDQKGLLWIATDNGLSQFDPAAMAFTNYDSRDGLQSNALNRNAIYKAEGGEIFIGSINGLNRFVPEKIRVNEFLTKVLLDNATIYGRKSYPVVVNVNEQTDSIVLEPHDKVITLSFVGLNFRNPSKNQYMYRLEGFNNEWIKAEADQRTVTYTNLSPGHYRFRVKGSNNDGVWSNREAVLFLTVKPPFWKTWWFIALLSFLAAFSVYLVIRLRVRSLNLRQKKLEAEVTLRTAELQEEKENLEHANRRITDQRDEIEAHKELIDSDRRKLEEAQKLIRLQNEQLFLANQRLEEKVKARTAELNATVEMMIEVSNELDHFVYRAAHDLRGPIARLEGLCYVGQLEKEKDRVIEYLQKIEEVSREMNSMLSRLLRTRTINKQELKIRDFNLASTVRRTIETLQKSERADGIAFNISVPSDVEVSSDQELVEILLENIVQNAIRFRDRRKSENFITVTSEYDREDTVLHIIDNGIGIPADIRQNVFDMFFVGTQRSSGFGLGLYEARIIARKLKGAIELDPADQVSTHLKIRLPNQLMLSEK